MEPSPVTIRLCPARIQTKRRADDIDLLDPGVLGVVHEHGSGWSRAGDDRLRLVEGGIGDRQAVASGHIAIGVIGERHVDHAAGDRGKGWPGAG